MNETISTILKRRSVRAYRPDPVGQPELDLMLEAARHAPSAMNQQPWHFTVIRNPEALAAQYDCTLAMENMMLAGTSLGLGSCWTNAIMMYYATEKGKAIFRKLGVSFPEGYQPYAAAAFGYPATPWPDAPPKKSDCVTFMD